MKHQSISKRGVKQETTSMSLWYTKRSTTKAYLKNGAMMLRENTAYENEVEANYFDYSALPLVQDRS